MNFLLYCLNLLLDLSITIILFYILDFEKPPTDVSLIQQSLIQQPITYFEIDNNRSTNQHNFFHWEGTYTLQKCWCEEYDEENNCIFRNCQNLVDGVKGFNLTIWKNTTFISQKATNYNYFTLLKQAKPYGVKCDEGYKQCGVLDSFNQTLCLLENETCPLNQIELSNSETPSDKFTNKDAVNTTLLNDNETYLHTSNAEINSPVMIDIILGPESFCFDSEERQLGPPYYEYEHYSTNSICPDYMGNETILRYISIDKQSKFAVYDENGIITTIQDFVEYSKKPYPLEELHNYTLHLYRYNYIGLNLTC